MLILSFVTSSFQTKSQSEKPVGNKIKLIKLGTTFQSSARGTRDVKLKVSREFESFFNCYSEIAVCKNAGGLLNMEPNLYRWYTSEPLD